MVLILLLYRQFGLAYLSGRSRVNLQGLDLGTRPQPVEITGIDGTEYEIDWPEVAAKSAAVVVVFALPTCPICGDLAKDVAGLPTTWPASKFVWVDGTITARPARAVDGAAGWVVGGAPQDKVHRAWNVSGAPFAYVVGRSGRIEAKGVVNTAADVERLLVNVLGSQAKESANGHFIATEEVRGHSN
jgi:hypothetical protein